MTLSKYLGSSPIIKILEFLITNKDSYYNLVEIRDFSGVGYSTLKVILPELLDNKLVIVRKVIGKSKLYQINIKNRVIKALLLIM